MHLPDFGSYAIWVWPAYGCTLAVFAINIIAAMREQATLRRRQAEQDGIAT